MSLGLWWHCSLMMRDLYGFKVVPIDEPGLIVMLSQVKAKVNLVHMFNLIL